MILQYYNKEKWQIKLVYYIISFLFSFKLAYAQTKTLRGVVFIEDSVSKNVVVENLSSKKVVITDEIGQFVIEASLNDTLLFSSIQLSDLRLIVSNDNIESLKLRVVMFQKNTVLKEVIIKNSSINAVSLGVVKKKIKQLTHAERKLKTAGDFKPVHLLQILGGSLDVDPILNAINGRTKKIKKEIQIEKKEAGLSYLNEIFFKYLQSNFKLSNESINRIFYYAIEDQNVQIMINSKENEKIKFFLLECLNILDNEQKLTYIDKE